MTKTFPALAADFHFLRFLFSHVTEQGNQKVWAPSKQKCLEFDLKEPTFDYKMTAEVKIESDTCWCSGKVRKSWGHWRCQAIRVRNTRLPKYDAWNILYQQWARRRSFTNDKWLCSNSYSVMVLREMHGAIFGPITICLRLESVELSVQFFFQASFVFSKLQHGQIQDMWYKLQPMTQKNELKT